MARVAAAARSLKNCIVMIVVEDCKGEEVSCSSPEPWKLDATRMTRPQEICSASDLSVVSGVWRTHRMKN